MSFCAWINFQVGCFLPRRLALFLFVNLLAGCLYPCFAGDLPPEIEGTEALYQRAVAASRTESTAEDNLATTELFKAAAAKGHAQAQYRLALRYLFGKGAAQDYGAAVPWLQKAARQGVVAAKFSLGLRYLLGQGVEKNDEQAVWWFGLAAKDGSREAAYYLDYVRAQKNVFSAQLAVAQKYLAGDGVEKDDAKAVYWLQKASDGGVSGAQFLLAEMCATGRGLKENLEQAVFWYQEAARNGEKKSFVKLAELFGQQGSAQADPVQAYAWLLLATEARDGQAGPKISGLVEKLTEEQASEGERLAAKLQTELAMAGADKGAASSQPPPEQGTTGLGPEIVATGAVEEVESAAFEDALDTDDFELTLPDYRKTLAMNPGDPNSYKNLALFYAREGFYAEATDTIQALIALQPEIAEHHALLANFYQAQQKNEPALAEYLQAVRLNPGKASYYRVLADIFVAREDYVAAWVAILMADSLGHGDTAPVRGLKEFDKKIKTSASLILTQSALHLRQIVVLSRREAESLVKALAEGADFNELVAAHSLPAFRANGGYLGFFQEHELSPAVVRAVKKLPPLQLSSIVETSAGFHLFQKIPVLDQACAFFAYPPP